MACSIQIQSVLYGNEIENLRRALDALQQGIRNCRHMGGKLTDFIVAYGDASPEPTFSEAQVAELAAHYAEEFQFVYRYFNENTGSAKGHNLLGENCTCDYMQIMNPDVIISPEYFVHIMEPFKRGDVGMTEARQSPIEHPKCFDFKTGQTSWATTACAVFPTHIFHQLGGFDYETFFLYCDDVDFSWRVRLLGKKVIYCPAAFVYHAKRLSASGGWKPSRAEVYYSLESSLFMAYKWSNDHRASLLLHRFKTGGDPIAEKAAEEFERRKKEGRLPKQLDPQHKVAEFTADDHYTQHRFVLS